MSLWERIRGHNSVEHHKGDGLELALTTVERFKARRFRFKGPGMKAAGVPGEEVVRFVEEELPDYYTYTTRVKTYSDRHDVPQARIDIAGTMGLSRELNRYNPFDVACTIKTETGNGA